MLQSLFYLSTALHVSGIIITHLQEQETTVTTASGSRYTVMDKVKSTDKENIKIKFAIAFSAEYILSTTIVILI
jgi:hypothetical protein